MSKRAFINPRRRNLSPSAGIRAFTITELLVLIGVLSVLLAMLLPAMSSARDQGRLTIEKNHARQLMIGFMAYANHNQDRVLPGFAPSHFRVFDQQGQLIKGGHIASTAKRRYPLRIAPYVDFDIRALMHDETLREMMNLGLDPDETFYDYAVSFAPSLGMNIQWVGGSSESGLQPPGLLSPSDGNYSAWNQLFDLNRYYVTRTSQVRHTDRLIVFASARGDLPQEFSGDAEGNPEPAEGHHRIISPYNTEMDPEPRWTDMFDRGDDPINYGHLSFRYRGAAVTAFFDGSVAMMDQFKLRDMRHWSNWATHEDWVLPLREQ